MRKLILPRRKFLIGATALIASPAIVRAQLAMTGVGGGSAPAAGGAAFTWDPTTAPTGATFSNSNRNYDNSTGVASYASAKTTASKASGKWYCEMKITTLATSTPQTGVGFADSGFPSTVSGNYLGSSDRSAMFFFVTASTFVSAFFSNPNASTITSLALNDLIQLAADFTNGQAWIGQNSTWMTSGGNPATGANPWLTWAGGQALFFAGMQDVVSAGTLSLVATTAGTIPSGFTAINA